MRARGQRARTHGSASPTGPGVGARLEGSARTFVKLIEQTVDRWSEIEGFRLGAAFSYYATFSLFPLLLLSVTLVGFAIGDDSAARDRMLAALAEPWTPAHQVLSQTLKAMEASRAARGTSAAVALFTLLFGASGVFIELDTALNKIWGAPPRKSKGGVGAAARTFARDRFVGFALALALGTTLLASLVTSSALAAVAKHAPRHLSQALLQTANAAASLALLMGLFTLVFHFVPRTRPPLREVVGAAALTTVLLSILKSVFASYLSNLTSYSAYGVVGGVLALATWIYLSAQVMFLSATLAHVKWEMNQATGDAGSMGRARTAQ